MQRTVILNIRALADHDGGAIASNDGVVPYTRPLADGHVPDHHRTRRDKDIRRNGGPDTIKRQNRHRFTSLYFLAPAALCKRYGVAAVGGAVYACPANCRHTIPLFI